MSYRTELAMRAVQEARRIYLLPRSPLRVELADRQEMQDARLRLGYALLEESYLDEESLVALLQLIQGNVPQAELSDHAAAMRRHGEAVDGMIALVETGKAIADSVLAEIHRQQCARYGITPPDVCLRAVTPEVGDRTESSMEVEK